VALSLERGLDMMEALFAVLKAGGAYVPVDTRYPLTRRRYIIEDSQAALVLDAAWLAAARAALATQPETAPECEAESKNLAYVIYTSGSTGVPKGVEVTQASVLELAAAQGESFKLEPGEAVLQFASLSFDAAVWDWALALLNGAALVLGTREKPLPGGGLEETVADHQVTLASLSPRVLSTVREEGLASLGTLIVSAEACPPELAARWSRRVSLRNEYGPTEARYA
jgi:non-ribosomal peptide synthetase component F